MSTSNATEPHPVGQRGGLRRNLTIWGAVGVALGLMAPSLAINLNPQAPALHVGRAVPLVFLLAVVGVMLVAYGFIRLCQSFHHAGSVYAFIGVTVGPRAGFVAGWTLLGTYLAYTATSVAAFGLFAQQFCISTGIWDSASWIPFSLLAYITIWVLAANEARFSTRTLITIETITVTLILIVAITIFAKLIGGTPPGNQSFTLSVFQLPSGVGYSALFFSLTFGFLSFAGFEGASTMGEETANPTKAIPLAILGCVVFAGIFYVFVSMAETMGFGTDAAGVTAFTSSGNLMGDLAKSYVGSWVGDVITLGVAFSALSSCLASAIGGSRLLFAFSRDGAFGGTLGLDLRPHWGAHGRTAGGYGGRRDRGLRSTSGRDHQRHRHLLLDGHDGHAGTAGLLRDIDLRRHALSVLRQGEAGGSVGDRDPNRGGAVPVLHALSQRVSGAGLAVQPVPLHRRRLGAAGRDRGLRDPRLRTHHR